MLFEKLQFLLFDMIFSMRTFWVVRAHFCCVFFLSKTASCCCLKNFSSFFCFIWFAQWKKCCQAVFFFFSSPFSECWGLVRSESLWYMQECFHNERYELFTRNGSLLLLFFLRFCECLQCLLMHFNFPFFFFLLCICFPFIFLNTLLFFFSLCELHLAASQGCYVEGMSSCCLKNYASISFLVWSCSCSFCSCASCQTSFFSFLFSGGFFRGGRNTLFV